MSNYGLDLNKIKKNFKQYQQPSNPPKSTGTNKYGDPVGTGYQGGSPNFYRDYTGKDGTFTPRRPSGKMSQPKPPNSKKEKAQKFKTDYANDLTKYMNKAGNTTTNTTSTETNNIGQNAGNKEDMTTNIGDYNDIKYSNIGNDYSVNIAGIGDGFSNMQGAAAYTALNNNQHARSSSEINGLKRAAQASEQATGLVGAKDRAANLYNSLGYSQNYWRQKADAQQNFYLGDIYSQKAPDFQMPESPSDPMDGDTTQDSVKKFENSLK